MEQDTDIGGAAREFPLTRASVVERLKAGGPLERAAFDDLALAYWKPVHAYLRLRWHLANEDAKDLTQAFFAAAIEKRFFAGFDPSRARFRTFVRVCLDRFASNERRARSAQRRGGSVEAIEIDEEVASESSDELFEAQWRRALVEGALDDLRRECGERGQTVRFEVFRRYDVEGAQRPTYEELAREHGLALHAVTNALSAARRDFRRLLLERLRASTHDEREFQDDLRALFGAAREP